jgi:hypothetical protein
MVGWQQEEGLIDEPPSQSKNYRNNRKNRTNLVSAVFCSGGTTLRRGLTECHVGAVCANGRQSISTTGKSEMIEQHITIAELAARLSCSVEKTRMLVMKEPGVACFRRDAKKGDKRAPKTMYRIPESVAERIVRRTLNPA